MRVVGQLGAGFWVARPDAQAESGTRNPNVAEAVGNAKAGPGSLPVATKRHHPRTIGKVDFD